MTSLDRGAFWVFPNQRCQGVTIGRTHARTASTDPGAAVTQSLCGPYTEPSPFLEQPEPRSPPSCTHTSGCPRKSVSLKENLTPHIFFQLPISAL